MSLKEKKSEIELGIPGLGKAKLSQTETVTKVDYRYSCRVSFDNPNDAMNFRSLVEKAVADHNGAIVQSHLDNEEVRVG